MASLLKSKLLPLHAAYFILMSMIGSVILYTKSTQINDLHYIDALFMSFSAMTGTGLSVVRLNLRSSAVLSQLLNFRIAGPFHIERPTTRHTVFTFDFGPCYPYSRSHLFSSRSETSLCS